MSLNTTSQEFFEHKYNQAVDPWNFSSSPYEQHRYTTIIGALGRPRFARAFEPGCSIGVLTQALARRCDEILAIDISPTAVARAQQRCRMFPNIHIQCGTLPQYIPDGSLDLILLSEIGYYFDQEELRDLTDRLSRRLIAGGILLAAHWLGSSQDHRLSGDEVHRIIRQNPALDLAFEHRFPSFRLDRMVRR